METEYFQKMFKSRIVQWVISIDPYLESITEQYFLDGYEESERVTDIIDEEECTIVSYKGSHSNEILIKRPNGVVTLYSLGVKQIEWIERDDASIGTITYFENGIVKLVQVRNEGETDIVRIANDIEGAVLEYEDPETNKIVFRGQFNESFQRDGLGNEYDRETGIISRQGIWENGKVVKYLREFIGDEMVEYDPEFPNLKKYDLNPIYRGGYCLDEKTGVYLRNGQGYLIKNHVTVGIGEWEHGVEVKKQDLAEGWYIQPEESEPSEVPEIPEVPELPEVPEPPEVPGDEEESTVDEEETHEERFGTPSWSTCSRF